MTRAEQARAEQVATALALLAPPPSEREACRQHVEGALDVMEDASIGHKVFASDRSGATTGARRAYNSAARKLLAADKALVAAGWCGPINRAEIERAIRSTEPRPKTWVRVHGSSVVRDKHKFALRLAHELLRRWNGAAITVSRDGTWHQLSVVLFGDRRVNLYRHLRTFAAEIRSRQK